MGTFMPALMLSGFLYDILNMPPAVRAITCIIPARYYVTLLQTLFLAGDIPSVIIPCCITLGVFAVALMGIARLKAPNPSNNAMDFLVRIASLVRKELLAVLRDKKAGWPSSSRPSSR